MQTPPIALCIMALVSLFAADLQAQEAYQPSYPASADSGYEAGYSTPTSADSFRHQPQADYSPLGDYRQPTSILVLSDREALVSTKLTGELVAVDLKNRTCRSVFRRHDSSLGKLVELDATHVAVADARQDQILILHRVGSEWHVSARLPAAGEPNDVLYHEPTRTLYASGKWSRRLYAWKLPRELRDLPTDSSTLNAVPKVVDLPMCGGCCLYLSTHDCLLVADAFGRGYAVVDAKQHELLRCGELYGHNIAELAATADEEFVFFPHQLLNEYARSVRNDITWGGLLSNNIRWLRTDRLLHASGEEIFKQGKFYSLGTPGNGAGDPTSMAVSSKGQLAVTLGGTNRVAVDQIDDYYFRQAAVGRRPVDCAFTDDETQLVVVNQFSDSISIVDLDDFEVEQISLGPLRPPTQVEVGEQQFFNAALSHDGWMSCHSCHSQGHTIGQLNDNHSDNSFGTPKRILSLLGQAHTMPYAWNGTVESLEQQARNSIISTMAGGEPDPETVAAIAEYIRALPPPPSLRLAREMSASESATTNDWVSRGKQVFQSIGCGDCHAGDNFTTPDTYDVGLIDENGQRQFNPPSLISVSQRQRALFHDARVNSLEDLLWVEKHQLPQDVSQEDLQALLQFLQAL